METNISDMKVGKELDIVIAEIIFGIKKVHYSEWDTEKISPQYIPSGKPWRTHQIDAKPIPRFSTDPSANYLIKLKMSGEYHWLIRSPIFLGCSWLAGLTPRGMTGWNGRPDYEAQGNTEMEAVCKAALILVSKKVVKNGAENESKKSG